MRRIERATAFWRDYRRAKAISSYRDLDERLGAVLELLILVDLIFRGPDREQRLKQLHETMSRDGMKADVSFFWRGGPGTPLPAVSQDAICKLRQLRADIETDFEVSQA